MPQQAPQQSLVDVAKASILAYNAKDWDSVRASVTSDFVYDEVSTQRRVQGIDAVLGVWRGWATALPDSKATFHNALVSGNTVVIELTWRGTHTGPLQTAGGVIAATGKSIELRACQVIEIAGDKAREVRQYFDFGTITGQLGVAS